MTTRDWQGVVILCAILLPLAVYAAAALAIALGLIFAVGVGAAIWDGNNKRKIDQMKAGKIDWTTDQKFLDLYSDYINKETHR